jgi:hypothetical protein
MLPSSTTLATARNEATGASTKRIRCYLPEVAIIVVIVIVTTATATARVINACGGKLLMCDGVCIRALDGATSAHEVAREKGPRGRHEHDSVDLHLPTSGHVWDDDPIKRYFFGYHQPFRGGRATAWPYRPRASAVVAVVVPL